MSKQPLTRTYCKRNRPLPYYIQIIRDAPRHWKFTQDHRTTRPPTHLITGIWWHNVISCQRRTAFLFQVSWKYLRVTELFIERARFVMHRQTDRRSDMQTDNYGKTNMSPRDDGRGRLIISLKNDQELMQSNATPIHNIHWTKKTDTSYDCIKRIQRKSYSRRYLTSPLTSFPQRGNHYASPKIHVKLFISVLLCGM